MLSAQTNSAELPHLTIMSVQAAKIAELEAERESARRSALAELTACRDAGLQAVYELEAQVSELAAEKERLQAEVVRQRASLSKNRVRTKGIKLWSAGCSVKNVPDNMYCNASTNVSSCG